MNTTQHVKTPVLVKLGGYSFRIGDNNPVTTENNGALLRNEDGKIESVTKLLDKTVRREGMFSALGDYLTAKGLTRPPFVNSDQPQNTEITDEAVVAFLDDYSERLYNKTRTASSMPYQFWLSIGGGGAITVALAVLFSLAEVELVPNGTEGVYTALEVLPDRVSSDPIDLIVVEDNFDSSDLDSDDDDYDDLLEEDRREVAPAAA